MRWLRSEIFTPAHLIFELKSGMMVDGVEYSNFFVANFLFGLYNKIVIITIL